MLSNIEEIVLEVQNGNKENFRLLIEQYQKQLYVYAYHFLGNRRYRTGCVC